MGVKVVYWLISYELIRLEDLVHEMNNRKVFKNPSLYSVRDN